MRKINNLKDEQLKGRLILVLSSSYKTLLKRKKEKGETLTYDELTYLNCPLNHDKIVDNIEYVFKNYYKNGKVNLSNIEYIDPEFGDCVIPYPDTRHKDKYIENSFVSNKLQYIKNKFGEKKMEEYENKIYNIKAKYDNKLQELKKEYNQALFEKNEQKKKEVENKINNIYKNIDNDLNKVAKNDPELAKYIEVKKEVLKNIPSNQLEKKNKTVNNTYLYYTLGGIFIILIALFLIVNKNKNVKKN